jgi:hypothetical protein
VTLRLAYAAMSVLAFAACTTPPRNAAPAPAADSASVPSATLAASIAAAAQRSGHESDPRVRAELADAARHDAEACIQAAANDVGCLYGRAVALGLEAKEHPTRAPSLLDDMLASLERAEAVDPSYDNAGPARVQALVLIRAPGWPLGPGDPERGLAAAQRATDLRPAYPPNLLALAEAQAKQGAVADARASYARARDAAHKLSDNADQAEWLRAAERGLKNVP